MAKKGLIHIMGDKFHSGMTFFIALFFKKQENWKKVPFFRVPRGIPNSTQMAKVFVLNKDAFLKKKC